MFCFFFQIIIIIIYMLRFFFSFLSAHIAYRVRLIIIIITSLLCI